MDARSHIWPIIFLATYSERSTTSARFRFFGLPALPQWLVLNIVPRYLPQYGMAPSGPGHATARPGLFADRFCGHFIFHADVDAQGGAYATGVLVLMTSAAIAVTLAVRRRGKNWIPFLIIAIVFIYTTIQNIHERPEGIKIASFFILTIILASLFSRVWRSTELRVERVELDDQAREFIEGPPKARCALLPTATIQAMLLSMKSKKREKRTDNHIPPESQFCSLK